MTRPLPRLALPLAAAGALLLAGCPLPQNLPDYPSTGTITPPRIQSDTVAPPGTVIAMNPACTGAAPSYTLSATLVDDNTLENVEVRWFLDYDPASTSSNTPRRPPEIIGAPQDGITFTRVVTPFVYRPYDFDATRAAGELHVVELVVSNNFAPEPVPPAAPLPRPYRTPCGPTVCPGGSKQFETQVYRWVFRYDASARCP